MSKLAQATDGAGRPGKSLGRNGARGPGRETTANYEAAHRRVRKMWGLASQYKCIRCSRQAREWAYDWTDPSTTANFSMWPEFYMPMCSGCHHSYDRAGCYAVIRKVERREVPWRDVVGNPRTEAEWDAYMAARRKLA